MGAVVAISQFHSKSVWGSGQGTIGTHSAWAADSGDKRAKAPKAMVAAADQVLAPLYALLQAKANQHSASALEHTPQAAGQ